MINLQAFAKYAEEYDAWYEKYSDVYESELAAIRQQMLKMPQNISGIEVGLGTGRFAASLGIQEGIEPVKEMADQAIKRGIEVMKGTAEHLPYSDMHFDFVLFVTICYLEKVPAAFEEAHRVLKRGGSIIVGFLDRDRPIAQSYEAKRQHSHFYKNAIFYSVDRVASLLEKAGFRNPEYMQTLFGDLDEIEEVQPPKEGFGEGSFVVVRAVKK